MKAKKIVKGILILFVFFLIVGMMSLREIPEPFWKSAMIIVAALATGALAVKTIIWLAE